MMVCSNSRAGTATLPGHLSSSTVLARFVLLCNVLSTSVCPFVPFSFGK